MSQRDELISLLGRKIIQKEDEEEIFFKDKKPVLAKYLTAPTKLRASYKGRMIKAHVKRNGLISFGSKFYRSPSLAGAVACKRGSCNGWTFWQYERAPGDWVPLNELRK
jgi:hypothetical protein